MTLSRVYEILRGEGLRLTFGRFAYAEGSNAQINEAIQALVEHNAPVYLHVLEIEDGVGCSAIAQIINKED